MLGQSKTTTAIGLVIGITVIGVAVYSVFFIEWDTRVPPEPPVIRPLKTMLIESPFAASARSYPGKVQANEEVDLAFQVSGRLIEFPLRKGQQVAQGELLGRLDPRDFESNFQARQGVLNKARADLEKVEDLFRREVASQQELTDARAAFDVADADAKVAAKALEDTSLYAPFKGVIADTFVDNFQNVDARQPVLSLQDDEIIEIVVNVPEERVIRAEKGKEKDLYDFVATFEYLPPDGEFELEFKEFSTEADPATQTYAATFMMPAPKKEDEEEGAISILPGVTATVREYPKEPAESEPVVFAVPIDAVPIDGQGNYFMWVVKDAGGVRDNGACPDGR
jgi:RND family efflux transporter MFP subunit